MSEVRAWCARTSLHCRNVQIANDTHMLFVCVAQMREVSQADNNTETPKGVEHDARNP